MVCCFCMTLTFGIVYSYGDFFIPLKEQFGWSAVVDSTIPAVSLIVFSIGSIIGGFLAPKLGNRKISIVGASLVGFGTIFSSMVDTYSELLVLFGIVESLGSALVVIVATSLVVKWFVKNRGLAVGVMAAGSGVGTLFVPPLTEYLIQIYNWRTSFMIIGLSFLAILLLSSYFMQTPEERSMNPYGWHGMTQAQRDNLRNQSTRHALFSQSFWLIYALFFLGSLVATMFVVHAVSFAESNGVSAVVGAEAVGLFGAGSLFSRIALGAISRSVDRANSVVISYVFELSGVLVLPFVVTIPSLFFLSAFTIGFGYGGFIAAFIALTGDLFGMKSVSNIWGISETAYGLGGLIGPIIAGAYFESVGSYVGVFQIGALVLGVALVISMYFSRHVRPILLERLSPTTDS